MADTGKIEHTYFVARCSACIKEMTGHLSCLFPEYAQKTATTHFRNGFQCPGVNKLCRWVKVSTVEEFVTVEEPR